LSAVIEDVGARLAAVLHELPQAIVIVGPSGEIQLANRRAQVLLEGANAFAAEAIESALRGETTIGSRTHLERGDNVLLVEYSTVPVRDPGGGVVAAVLTFQDLTERELRDRAQREFITNAAHELQTPLAAILSAVQVLKAGAKDDAQTRDRFLDHIDNAVDRLDRLMRALLVLARAQTRQEEPKHEVIQLLPLLEDVASALLPATVPMTVNCKPETAVITNRPLLEQALINLGSNALKHSRGPVTLSARRDDGRVSIEIVDTGPGIPASEQARVFDRFYRVRDGRDEGFGLGLAIVREVVDVLKGEIQLDSSASGTRVSIRLPGARVRKT
jgi:two-component system phosphate regulon sensor histidine kinase PhoR